jgi:hypothetical protein
MSIVTILSHHQSIFLLLQVTVNVRFIYADMCVNIIKLIYDSNLNNFYVIGFSRMESGYVICKIGL